MKQPSIRAPGELSGSAGTPRPTQLFHRALSLKLLLALLLLLQVAPIYATQQLPATHRTAVAQRPIKEASKTSTGHAWKFALLGLAALSFLIRKRL